MSLGEEPKRDESRRRPLQSESRMASVWLLLLLLLLPSLLTAQVTPDLTDNSTDSLTNRTSDVSSLRPSEPSGFAAAPSEAPTEQQEDDWSPAEEYLYTGDAAALEAARCSRAYGSPGQTGSLPVSFGAPLRPALDALASYANFLNMIFQASDLRESTVQEDMEWYHALVRALLEADALVQQAFLTFDAEPTSPVPQLVLRAARDPAARVQTIVLQDLSRAWESLHPPAPAPDDSWFRSFKFSTSNQPAAALTKRLLLNDLSTLDTPKWGQGDSYVTDRSGVRWAGAPFLVCKDGHFVPGWMLTLSTSFYGLKPDLTPEFRGVIRVDVNIQDIDLDQCTTTGDGWFADTHQCNRTTMECVPTPGQGFRLGQYCCRCKEGYYNPELDGGPVNATDDDDDDGDDDGGDDDGGRGSSTCYPNMPICLPCWPGCKSCQDGAPCWVQEDWLLRAAVLAVQGVFMLLIFISMLAAYRHRRNRRIRASGLLLLEAILFGSLLLYFPVFILFFRPSTFRCILLRWVRMLGFSIVYGTVTLKMHRVLKVFLSRTAQRVPYMSSLHLLRILGVMLMTVSWFLCAWTVGVLQNRDRNIPVFVTTTTTRGQGFNLCYMDRWDYMMAVAELLFLCWGSSLWTAVRPVPSAFHEPRYMGIAIHNELLLSSMFHLFRFTFPSLHPDWMLLLSFTHTHITITVTLALLFIPKFHHVSKPSRAEIAAEVYEDEVDLRRTGSYLNSSFHSAWSERSVDPDDFRDELKKLYTQLEVHKTKKMTANNPHLSKKRSSRCAIGRSIIKRLAEFPESMSRQCSREDRDGSFRSRSVNLSESFRRTPDTISISYKSSMKSPSPSPYMRKSSLFDSTLKINAVKRSSQRSETDSLDIPAGVCKSASAQNLSIDTNLLHPDHTRLHKSWSLTSTSSHSIENVSKVNRASTVLTRSRQSIGEQTRSALQSESFDKAEVCPWDVAQEPSANKNQKHVNYADSEDQEDVRPPSPQALVCPWDHLPPVQRTPSEDKGLLCESPKPQPLVSASAPGSPRPKFTKDQRVFSFRSNTTTNTGNWLSVKTIMGSMDAGYRSSKERNLNKEDSVSQKSQESASATPRSATSSRRPSVEKKTLQKRSMTADGKPCLVKQNAVRLSSADSADRSPRSLAVGKSAVYPWDVDDAQKDGNYENVFLSRQNSKRGSVSSWETASSSRTPSTHRRGSYRKTPVRNVPHADVCPWEAGTGVLQQGDGAKKQQSTRADIYPWETQTSEHVCPWESHEQGTVRRQGSDRGDTLSKQTKRQPSLQCIADVCPWDTAAETPQPSTRQGNEYANICPWDIQAKAEVVYENLNPLETKGTLTVPHQPEIRPALVNNEQSAAFDWGKQVSKTADSCPWDFPEPPKIVEEGSSEHPDATSQMTIKVDICPWDAGNQDKPGDSQQVTGTLKAGIDRMVRPEEENSTRVNICPWETEPCLQGQRETGEPQSGKTEARGNVCPWETEEPKVLTKQDSTRADVCPWDSEEPKVLTKQDSTRADGCPWDSEEPKVLTKQDSTRADVCPWDSEEPKVLTKQDSTRADVCPWDSEEPKVLTKQDSTRADVCPWDSEEPKVLTKQDSTREDVCPWDSEEPNVLTKQSSYKADVCPWDSEEPNVLKKQDSARADVCPWDSEEPDTVKERDDAPANVCSADPQTSADADFPYSERHDIADFQEGVSVADTQAFISPEQMDEAKANLALGRRDALCPWEMVRSRSGSFTDNVSDVFTWEPENIPEEDEEDDAECAAEALVFPPDL